jgi:hypothetical protein
MTGTFSPEPYTESQLFEQFRQLDGVRPHLMTLYSFAVALNAQTIVDLGIGLTTKALRAAALLTGGTVFSCDADQKRYSYLSTHEDEHWRLFLGASERFIRSIQAPIDFAVHDAAHDYFQVKLDLQLLLPKMRTFGLICFHDTQQTDLADEMLAAIKDASGRPEDLARQSPLRLRLGHSEGRRGGSSANQTCRWLSL